MEALFLQSFAVAAVNSGDEVSSPAFLSVLQLLGVLLWFPDPWITALLAGAELSPAEADATAHHASSPAQGDLRRSCSPDGQFCVLLGVIPVAQPGTCPFSPF